MHPDLSLMIGCLVCTSLCLFAGAMLDILAARDSEDEE